MATDSKGIVLVDTDVMSYRYFKRQEFDEFKPYLAGAIPAISFVTYAEALGGAYKANWGERKIEEYKAHLRTYLLIPADQELAAVYARLYAECSHNGVTVSSDNDLWIAATAFRHGLPVLSNDGVFRRIKGLTVLPP